MVELNDFEAPSVRKVNSDKLGVDQYVNWNKRFGTFTRNDPELTGEGLSFIEALRMYVGKPELMKEFGSLVASSVVRIIGSDNASLSRTIVSNLASHEPPILLPDAYHFYDGALEVIRSEYQENHPYNG